MTRTVFTPFKLQRKAPPHLDWKEWEHQARQDSAWCWWLLSRTPESCWKQEKCILLFYFSLALSLSLSVCFSRNKDRAVFSFCFVGWNFGCFLAQLYRRRKSEIWIIGASLSFHPHHGSGQFLMQKAIQNRLVFCCSNSFWAFSVHYVGEWVLQPDPNPRFKNLLVSLYGRTIWLKCG